MVVYLYAAGLLLFRRAPDVEHLLLYSNLTGMWTPPGERGCVVYESLLQAAIRNAEEQTGIAKQNITIVDTFSKLVKEVNGENITLYFVGQVKDGNTPISLNNKNNAYLWSSLVNATNMVKDTVYHAMKTVEVIETMLKPFMTEMSSTSVHIEN